MTNLYQYDALNRLTNLVWKTNGTTIASFYYQLGLAGNRTNLNETVNGVSRTYAWLFDNLYRLTNENISAIGNVGYALDPAGKPGRNRSSTISGLANQLFAYNTNDWLAGDQYDNNGNTTNSASKPYFYDVMNRLANYNNSVYLVYNGDGSRVKKTVGSVTTYYLVDDRNPSGYPQVLEEWTAIGGVTNLSRIYNWGLSLVSQTIPGASTNFFGFDGHGSTRFLTGLNGNITGYLYI